MNREAAREALTDMKLSEKMVEFLLSSAEQFGNGAHLDVEVVYTAQDGFAVIDCSDHPNVVFQVKP